ncbi:MAG: PleD family two-component system response regulator [Magnetococcales bacterium]|nr:PleD family two-component system response regulator [Magnetococcales bacterium]
MNRNDAERARLLIVDDAPTNLRFMGSILREEHEILVATNGLDALKVAETEKPDLILLDIMMPVMDGYETCRRLKNNPVTRDIPVIFVTARDQEEDEERGLELGAIDYVSKPCSPSIIRIRIRNHLELKRHRDRLERLSTLDGLTGVANRRAFDAHLDREWRRALRFKETLSLIMLDIDFFKRYNDHYGHAGGDECLRSVAGGLRSNLNRAVDFVARYGGEEFAVILPQTDLDGALVTAEKMREAINGLRIPHENSDAAAHVTISLGCATMIPLEESGMAELLKQADQMLYESKRQGRNRVTGCVWTPTGS